MSGAEFDALLGSRLRRIAEVLRGKEEEYATARDRLHNFKEAAALTGESPAQICVGFAVKHWVSLVDIVNDLSRGDQRRLLLFEEKLGDALNYLILLEALIVEGAP